MTHPVGLERLAPPQLAWEIADSKRSIETATGLPVGVQCVAHPWREDVALRAAAHLEAALGGWQPPPAIEIS